MALIPPYFTNTVVALGVKSKTWIASGFLYGQFQSLDESKNRKNYKVFLVTNRHVLNNKESMLLRFNPKADKPAKDYLIALKDDKGNNTWTDHPKAEIDVAVVPIGFNKLREEGMQAEFFQSDSHVADIKKIAELGVTEGDFVFTLGFPMGLVGKTRRSVIVRSGAIARIKDALAKSENEFLIDVFTFPGNSGGPVIIKPEPFGITGTKVVNKAYLIGVIHSYIPYQDTAISQQTGKARIIFEENSGLSVAHTVDCIEETITENIKKVATEKIAKETQKPI